MADLEKEQISIKSSDDISTYPIITHHKRAIEMYHVLKQELDILISGFSSLHMALFGIASGAAITCYVTYNTAQLPEPLKTKYWMATFLTTVLAIYFGLMAGKDWFKARKEIQRIKNEVTTETITVTTKQQ